MNILIPTDLSPNAQSATDFALRSFNLAKARVVLLHAVVPHRSSGGMLINLTNLLLQDSKQQLDKERDRLKAIYGKRLKITVKAQAGFLPDLLPELAKVEQADLIVMGTKGTGNIAAKILGSNAEHIIRTCPAPVLAIPFREQMHSIERVLIATERMELIQQDMLIKILDALQIRPEIEALTILTDEHNKAAKSLEINGRHIPVTAKKATKVVEGLNNHLKENHYDLMILYHQHNTRWDHLLQRSITTKFTGTMQVPLLVLPV